MKKARSNAVPTLSYDRFDSDNSYGRFEIEGKRQHWRLEGVWLWNEARLDSLASEVRGFVAHEMEEVDQGLREIERRNGTSQP